MKPCPFCAEEIQDDAVVCKWCHSDLAQYPVQAAQRPPETSGKAIASLILGFCFFLFPAAVLAIVLGHVARAEIRRSQGRLRGSGMALTGLIFGYVGASCIPLIIAAIAIPNLLRSRMAANEASAVGSLRTVSTAAISYSSTFGHGFPVTLAALGPPPAGASPTDDHAGLIEATLAGGSRHGYVFTYRAYTARAGGKADFFTINADPVTAGTTGQRHFFMDQSGIIRFELNAPASEESPPLQ